MHPRLQCNISKSINFNKYIDVFNKTGHEPRELLRMKQVQTANNPLLHTIIANLCNPPGYAYNVNGAWYQFHVVNCWKHAIRIAQIIVSMPSLMPRSVRYVDIVFA